MRETTKKNMRIMWAVVIAFGILCGAILFRYMLEKEVYYVIPICIILIVLAYYLHLYVKQKSYAIIYDRKGFDTLLLYMCPLLVMYNPDERRKFDRGYSKMFSMTGLTVPRFNVPKNREEFEELKKSLDFNIIENIAGCCILLVLSLFMVYYSYIYMFFETVLFCIDVFLMFLILFTSAQIVFTLMEDTGVFDISRLDETAGPVSENEAMYNDYLIASRMLMYSQYDRNITGRAEDRTFLIDMIADYLDKPHTVEHLNREELFIADFIVRLYTNGQIDSVPESIARYADFLVEEYEPIAIEHKSKFRDNIKEYILAMEHVVEFCAKDGRTEEGNRILEKIKNLTLDPKKDKEVIYLNRRNQLLLQGTDEIPGDLVFERNSLDVISELTENFAIPNEKPAFPKISLKLKKKDEEASETEDAVQEEQTDESFEEAAHTEEVAEEAAEETSEVTEAETAEETEETSEGADEEAAEEETKESETDAEESEEVAEDCEEADEVQDAQEESAEESDEPVEAAEEPKAAEEPYSTEGSEFDEDFSDVDDYEEIGEEENLTPSVLDENYSQLTPEALENEASQHVEQKEEGRLRKFMKKIRKEDEMLDASNDDIRDYVGSDE